MIKAPERVEIPEQEELRRDRFARILAVLIVVATLGVATVEYLHSLADQSLQICGKRILHIFLPPFFHPNMRLLCRLRWNVLQSR